MAQKDKEKWDKKYKENPSLLGQKKSSEKLKNIINYIKKGKALEIACGAGRNSIYLANKGFEVEALDISDVAIKNLRKLNIKNINAIQIDLDCFLPKENTYDLIVMTNFLDRQIIPKLSKALKKDGILFIETYMFHEENERFLSNKSFLLEKDELKTFFDCSFEILEYDEFFDESYELHKMRKQVISVKKI